MRKHYTFVALILLTSCLSSASDAFVDPLDAAIAEISIDPSYADLREEIALSAGKLVGDANEGRVRAMKFFCDLKSVDLLFAIVESSKVSSEQRFEATICLRGLVIPGDQRAVLRAMAMLASTDSMVVGTSLATAKAQRARVQHGLIALLGRGTGIDFSAPEFGIDSRDVLSGTTIKKVGDAVTAWVRTKAAD